MSGNSKIFDLIGKKAIVTGGASGIGRAIALDLAKFGADVIIVDLNKELGERVVEEIRFMNQKAFFINGDVSKKTQTTKIMKFAEDKFKTIDILINNAGILSHHVQDVSEKEWNRMMNINLKSVLFCSQAVAPYMIKRKSGKIVNMGSSLSSRGSVFNIGGGGVDYCVSKASVQALTRMFAFHLASYGINVNAIAPGIIDTEMHKNNKDRIKSLIKYIPFGRLGEPQDISSVAIFLATDAARYITGQTIHVNGGMLMID